VNDPETKTVPKEVAEGVRTSAKRVKKSDEGDREGDQDLRRF
jgi:hypothetical protein